MGATLRWLCARLGEGREEGDGWWWDGKWGRKRWETGGI